MVLIISTFRVANGMEGEVSQAFLDRPRLVEEAPGFLGMEVAVDRVDSSIFHLLTRWTDEASFQRWHSGPSHKLSHSGIPKGLKLDASHTVVRRLNVLADREGHTVPLRGEDSCIANLSQFLANTHSLYWLKVSSSGEIIAANPAFESLLHDRGESLAGRSLWDLVTQPDAASLQAILQGGVPHPERSIMLNFVSWDHVVYTLECLVERHSEDFVLLGELPRDDDRALARELLDMNNRWALLVRENEKSARAVRQAKEDLEKALAELNQSHWHLRKIQETLPICMYCGKVKTGEAQWEGVVEYLKENSLFLTHGCCPGCLQQMIGPAKDTTC